MGLGVLTGIRQASTTVKNAGPPECWRLAGNLKIITASRRCFGLNRLRMVAVAGVLKTTWGVVLEGNRSKVSGELDGHRVGGTRDLGDPARIHLEPGEGEINKLVRLMVFFRGIRLKAI